MPAELAFGRMIICGLLDKSSPLTVYMNPPLSYEPAVRAFPYPLVLNHMSPRLGISRACRNSRAQRSGVDGG